MEFVWLVAVAVLVLAAASFGLLPRLGAGAAARRRLDLGLEDVSRAAAADEPDEDPRNRGLRRWLYLAGIRGKLAVPRFLLAMGVAVVCGFVASWWFMRMARDGALAEALGGIPGNLDGLFRPILLAGPWLVFVFVAALPILVVRGRRRRLVFEVEQDMPITLELLATLSEAGLGFDAALTRILESEADSDRPLFRELRTFQLESRAGMSRVQSFRRLAWRIDIPSLATFVSALVQAEQMGAGLAQVLRQQADDLRGRRRERAFMLAQALPVKLVFPLVICFLPAIFVFTLGPAFYSLFQSLASAVGGR